MKVPDAGREHRRRSPKRRLQSGAHVALKTSRAGRDRNEDHAREAGGAGVSAMKRSPASDAIDARLVHSGGIDDGASNRAGGFDDQPVTGGVKVDEVIVVDDGRELLGRQAGPSRRSSAAVAGAAPPVARLVGVEGDDRPALVAAEELQDRVGSRLTGFLAR